MRRRTIKRTRRSKRIQSKRNVSKKTNIPKKRSKVPNIKFCMISYKGNADFAKLTQRVLKKEWGYSCKIYWGYKIDNDKYTHTNAFSRIYIYIYTILQAIIQSYIFVKK